MLDFNKEYQVWLEKTKDNKKYQDELKSLSSEEIQDRFYQDLEFGTAGLRGIVGVGTNRMNELVIARASKALACVIENHGSKYKERGIVIGHDSRNYSKEFARLTALIMASNNIKTYLFEDLRPTPEVSFAILKYNAVSAVNITASHNPKEYNGYKVYWEEASQIKDEIAKQILSEIKKLDLFKNYVSITFEEALEKGLIEIIGSECDESYYSEVLNTSKRDDSELDKSIKIVYTPLNGAGNIPVRTVLARKGFENVYVVSEQEKPDGNFPTLIYPNPEDLKAFEYSEKLAKKVNADILIATDPDCDRLAVEIMHHGNIIPLNGNQTGVLLIDYLIKTLKDKNLMPKNPVIVKSIVTGNLGREIAKKNGVETINVLTGFKNICAVANEFEKTKEKKYIFGYEESIGYNIGTFVRDKDGVTSALLLAEMAAYYKKQGKTLIDVLEDIFKEYGYYVEEGISIVLKGIEGQQRIKRMMKEFRNIYPKQIGDISVVKINDYLNRVSKDVVNNTQTGIVDIEKTDAVEFSFSDQVTWFTLRPSGTEPKIKIYLYTMAKTKEEALKKLNEVKEKSLEILMGIE